MEENRHKKIDDLDCATDLGQKSKPDQIRLRESIRLPH
jgi:hypothetical protein